MALENMSSCYHSAPVPCCSWNTSGKDLTSDVLHLLFPLLGYPFPSDQHDLLSQALRASLQGQFLNEAFLCHSVCTGTSQTLSFPFLCLRFLHSMYSPSHVLPYTVYNLVMYFGGFIFCLPSRYLERELHPSLNPFVYFCIFRA